MTYKFAYFVATVQAGHREVYWGKASPRVGDGGASGGGVQRHTAQRGHCCWSGAEEQTEVEKIKFFISGLYDTRFYLFSLFCMLMIFTILLLIHRVNNCVYGAGLFFICNECVFFYSSIIDWNNPLIINKMFRVYLGDVPLKTKVWDPGIKFIFLFTLSNSTYNLYICASGWKCKTRNETWAGEHKSQTEDPAASPAVPSGCRMLSG